MCIYNIRLYRLTFRGLVNVDFMRFLKLKNEKNTVINEKNTV